MKAKSVGCVLFRQEKNKRYYLLLEAQRINDKLGSHTFWDFPKGTPNSGENELQTALRETQEETGIKDVEFIDGFRNEIKYFFKAKGKLINKEVVFYLAKTSNKKAKVSHEHIRCEWLTYEQAMNRLTFRNSKIILESAEKFLRKEKIKAVIFDWNGVITDSLRLDYSIFMEEMKNSRVKTPGTMKFYRTLYDGNIFDKLTELGIEFHKDGDRVYKELFIKGLDKAPIFPGVKMILEKLHERYTIAMITSNYSSVVAKFNEKYGTGRLFDMVLTSDVNRYKEENIKMFLKKFSLKKSEVMFIGDTAADIAACKNSGLRIIAVTWGYHKKSRLKKEKPDFIADKPEDIIKILEKIEWKKK